VEWINVLEARHERVRSY